jgi:hypothetical protein
MAGAAESSRRQAQVETRIRQATHSSTSGLHFWEKGERQMKKKERMVYYYDVVIVPSSQTCATPSGISVQQALQLIEKLPKEQREQAYSRGQQHFYIEDWKTTKSGRGMALLVNKSDKEIADPVFSEPAKKKRRTVNKVDEEGQDFSVHILFKFPKDPVMPALALVESCNGMGIVVLQRFLSKLIDTAKALTPAVYVQNHPDGSLDANGKPKTCNVKYHFRFDGHISDELIDDLNAGKIQSIELITDREKETPFDEEGYIVEKTKSLTLETLDEKHRVRNKGKRILDFITSKKTDYSKARIKFVTDTGVPRTVDLDSNDAENNKYVKREKLVDFENDLKGSYEAIHPELLTQMAKLLKDVDVDTPKGGSGD